jgi:hypothetical protein
MYDNFELCDRLNPKEICPIVEQYREGVFERKFHEHVPRHRLSEDALRYLLIALVLKFENNEPWTVVRTYLNGRGKDPSAHRLAWHVTYPEAGVIRKYCGTNTHAWADQIISADKFRIQRDV